MQKPTKEQWYQRFKNIPEELREAMIAEESADAVDEIVHKNNLKEDQADKLASLSGMVMLGFLHPRDFISTISEEAGVPMMMARDIAQQVNERIFKQVRSQLKELHGLAGDASAGNSNQVAQAPRIIRDSVTVSTSSGKVVDGNATAPIFALTGGGELGESGAKANRDLERLEQERETRIISQRGSGAREGGVDSQVKPIALGPRSEGKDASVQAVSGNATVSSSKLFGVVSRPPERINLAEQVKPKNNAAKDPYREAVD